MTEAKKPRLRYAVDDRLIHGDLIVVGVLLHASRA